MLGDNRRGSVGFCGARAALRDVYLDRYRNYGFM